VAAFVVSQCRARRSGSAKVTVTALRSLLRFLFLQGYTPCPLAQAVPTATGWADQSLPRALSAKALAELLESCDRHTVVGTRDFAMLTLLARLGLRAGEVAALTLDDIDWHHGEMVVRGKGGRQEQLPLPVDVGEAIVAYLRHRPSFACRALFLRCAHRSRG
jgi:site-specific recombinase XerC